MGLFIHGFAEGKPLRVSGRGDFSTPPPEKHQFDVKWVERMVDRKVVEIGGGLLTIMTDPPTVYRIVRTPGAYGNQCGDRLADGPARTSHQVRARQDYIDSCTSKPKCTGAEVIHFYDCVLEEES